MKAVVQQTGLKPDTLRAWERRYGLPIPKRSEGGHRLYSQRDIDTVKWLMARQRDGLSISRAVKLWQQVEAQALRNPQAPVAYGGLVFNLLPALRQRIAGHFLGEQLEAAPPLVESLMTASRPVPATDTVPLAYLKALDHFKERQGFIEAHVIQSLNSERYAQKHLAQANRELGLNIGAALALGNMDFLGTNVEWVNSLLRIYQLPLEMLYEYLHAYHKSAGEQLDERGQPIVAWLARLLNGYTLN